MQRVGDFLTGDPVLTLNLHASAFQAAQIMARNKIGAMLVVDDQGLLQGIFTERDLMTRVVVEGLDARTTKLRDVMTREVFSVERDQKVCEVRSELQRRHIRHLPVVDQGRVVGMLSLRDILRADLEEKSSEVRALEDYFIGGTGT